MAVALAAQPAFGPRQSWRLSRTGFSFSLPITIRGGAKPFFVTSANHVSYSLLQLRDLVRLLGGEVLLLERVGC